MDTNLKKHIVYAVIAVLFFGLGYYAYTRYNEAPIVQEDPHPQEIVENNDQEIVENNNPTESSDGTPGTSVSEHIITYTDNGYTPKSLTVKNGDTVTYKNNSAKSMWPASAKHPTHEVYSGTTLADHCPDASGTAFDACKGIAPGSSWSFVFHKPGSWNYHDHLTPTFFGSVVVQ
jgi:plastocyanin